LHILYCTTNVIAEPAITFDPAAGFCDTTMLAGDRTLDPAAGPD